MNQYHIYDQIGRGSNSVVYKGRKKQTVSYFAIKKVKKDEKARVLQEVRTFHMLHHDNVLKFHEWYETSNHLWLILEYCVGGDLLALLKQDVQLPEESIHDFGRDCAHALQFLHSNGIIYGDLKPSNVLLDENGRPKLCDFGLSRRLADIANTSHVHLPQAKRGTPCYMAPELLQDEGVHSFSSDLWSLGCVMYECYCGQPPFSAQTLDKLLSSILLDELPPLPGTPSPEFQDLLHRLLAKDPAQRIGWDELRTHRFWRQPIRTLPLPPQPAFEYYLQKRSTGLGSLAQPGPDPAPEPAEDLVGQEQRGTGAFQGADGCGGSSRERMRESDSGQDQQLAPSNKLGPKGSDNPAGRSRERNGGGGSGEGREALADVPSAEVNALDGAGRLGSSGDKIGGQGWETGSGGSAADMAVPGMGALGQSKGRSGVPGGPKLSGSGGSSHVLQQAAVGGQGLAPGTGDRAGAVPDGTGYPAAHQDSAAAVRALRLSRIARTNLEKDADAEGSLASYRHGPSGMEVSMARSSGREDIILENNDLEFDFGVRQGGEGEPDGGTGAEGEEESEGCRLTVNRDAEDQENGGEGSRGEGRREEVRGARQEEEAGEDAPDEGAASMSSTGHIELDLTSEARQSASVSLAPRSPAYAPGPEGPLQGQARATDALRANSSAEGAEAQDQVEAVHAKRQALGSPGAGSGAPRVNGGQQRPGDTPKLWGRGVKDTGGQAADGVAEVEGRTASGMRTASGKVEDRQGPGEKGTDSGQGTATVEALSEQLSGGPVGPVNSREEVQRQVEGCMWHESDFAVRSVVLNVTIEQLPAPAFDARHVPSSPEGPRNPYTAEDLVQLSAEEQVKLFGNLAARLRRPAPSDEHMNCIRYIQSLAHSKGAANILIASPLMSFIVRCLSSARTPASRIELCSAVGLLVRQATEIPDELAGSGIVSVLTEAVRDRQARRRAMAALGELVFYIATRSPQPAAASSSSGSQGWHVPATTISLIASMLNAGEDDVTQHYAVKTIENVAGEGPAWASRFATQSVVADLARIFRHPSSRQEHLRACAGSALVRLLRHSPSLGTALLEALGTPWKVAGTLKRSSPREQQPLLNILNLLLLTAVAGSPGSSAALSGAGAPAVLSRTPSQSALLASLDDRGLLQTLIGLLENNGPLGASPVVKGKALVACGLLCRLQPSRWVPALQSQAREQRSLALAIERLSKDKESYVLQCLEVLASSIASCVPGLIKNVGRDLTSINAMLRRPALGAPGALAAGNGSARGRGGPANGRGADSQGPQGSGLSAAQQQVVQQGMKRVLEDLDMILKLLNSSLIRPRIIQGDLISSLARFIGHSHSPLLQGQHELQTALMQAVEALCLQPQQLLQHLPELRSELLPALTALYSKSQSVEMRFLAFVKLCNLVSLLLDTLGGQARALGSHESDPGGGGTVAGAVVGPEAAQEGERVVREFVQQLLLPLFPSLLHEKDEEMLLPSFAQRMLVNLLDRGLVDPEKDLQDLKLTGRCFELLLETEDFSAVNMHSLRLCLILAALPQVTLHNATDLRVFSRLGALLEHVVRTPELDEFVDPVVSLCFLVLEGHLEEGEGGAGALAPAQEPGEWAGAPRDAGAGAAGGKEKLRASLAVRRGGWGGREEMKGEEEEKTSQGKILQDINQMARYSPVLLQLVWGENELVAEIATDCLQLLLRTTPAPVLGAVKESIEDVSAAISSAVTRLRPEVAVKQELLLLEAVAEACQEELRRRRTGVPAPGPAGLLSPLSTPSRRHGTGKVCCWTRAQLAGLRDAVKGLRATAEGNEDVECGVDEALLVIEQLQQDGIFN